VMNDYKEQLFALRKEISEIGTEVLNTFIPAIYQGTPGQAQTIIKFTELIGRVGIQSGMEKKHGLELNDKLVTVNGSDNLDFVTTEELIAELVKRYDVLIIAYCQNNPNDRDPYYSKAMGHPLFKKSLAEALLAHATEDFDAYLSELESDKKQDEQDEDDATP